MTYYITAVTGQQRKKGRCNIYTDDGFLLSLSDETVIRYSIKAGTELTEERLAALREEDTFKYAKELAFKYTVGAMRTEKQLLERLLTRGVDELTAKRAAEVVKEYGYIDDEKYAREYARAYLKKYSAYVVKQRLIWEGVSEQTAAEAVSAEDDKENVRALFEKYAKKYEGEEPLKRKKHIADALARRGFTWSQISGFFDDDGY